MTIQVQHEAFDRVTGLMADLQSALRSEHDHVSEEVAALLGSGWSGLASEQFGQGWQEWCRGMHDLLSGIARQTALVSGVRADLDRTDGSRAQAAALLQQRLGPR